MKLSDIRKVAKVLEKNPSLRKKLAYGDYDESQEDQRQEAAMLNKEHALETFLKRNKGKIEKDLGVITGDRGRLDFENLRYDHNEIGSLVATYRQVDIYFYWQTSKWRVEFPKNFELAEQMDSYFRWFHTQPKPVFFADKAIDLLDSFESMAERAREFQSPEYEYPGYD